MNIRTVVVITDCKDVAFNEMRRIIINECSKLGIENIEVELVSVAEFSLINAAFLTRLMADYYPEKTVFSVVINPQRHRSARIYGETKSGIKFFGANTGALSWLLSDFGYKSLYEVHDPGFVSFGGKYVHAPNVAKLVAEQTIW
jgi:S-adenosylmethionine hydrolase